MIIDDLYNILLSVWNSIVSLPVNFLVQMIMGFLMPVVFPILYFIISIINYIIGFFNVIINCVNIMIAIPNLLNLLITTYFYNLPGIWASPLIAGVLIRFWYGTYAFFKRHTPIAGKE